MPLMDLDQRLNSQLSRRAERVIPGGMYGHQDSRRISERFPQFFRGGTGAIIEDVDGNEYVDLMCSWGPIVLGRRDPVVDAAVQAQMMQGECLNGPSSALVELSEKFVETVADADWAIIARNGTDATTTCLTVTRAHTGRSIVLVATGSYHGAVPWCTPVLNGTLPSDRAAMRYFRYNDINDFDRAVAEAGGDLAGVMLTPFQHVEGLNQQLVEPSFARHVRRRCDEADALLILDDVRCGFRLAYGGSWEPLGVPVDLSAWSKAIANGYPIAAVTGKDFLRDAASSIFITGSFWMNAIAMAASIATLDRLRELDGVALMERAGGRLRQGLLQQAESAGLSVSYTGPDVMPYMTFAADLDHERLECFADAALQHGVYLHPRHNWFMSCALDDAVVDRALAGTEQAFAEVLRTYGAD